MDKDKVYFSNEGLTSTSCNFIANQAKEYCQTVQEELDSTNFVNGTISLIGGEETTTEIGVESLEYMQKDLDTIVKAHSLIAWLREALKAKDNLSKEIKDKPLAIWCQENDKEYPQQPMYVNPINRDDVLATWTIKDRNRYLTLGAKVSTYGKFLHPNGVFALTRKGLKQAINNPVKYRENGRDTIIEKYSPSIDVDTVDKEFYRLQGEWRKAQAELNCYEHKIQLAIDKDTNEKNTKYQKEQSDYENKMKTLSSEFRAWKDLELQKIANLKIQIPHDLEDIYNKISNLSK